MFHAAHPSLQLEDELFVEGGEVLLTAASTYGGSRDVAEEAGQAETRARYHQERPATQLDSVSLFIGSYCLGIVIPFV
jgi:hypothetical protein